MLGKLLCRATPIIFRLKTPTAACSIRGLRYGSPRPNSFTGEDVLELQGHGGPVILDLLLKRILTIPGLRIARPGEFSERAFLNDKLDLAQSRGDCRSYRRQFGTGGPFGT